MPKDNAVVCNALALHLGHAAKLLADVPLSCPHTAPAAAELIIRIVTANVAHIEVVQEELLDLLAAVAEYCNIIPHLSYCTHTSCRYTLQLTTTSASPSCPVPSRRAADNSSRRYGGLTSFLCCLGFLFCRILPIIIPIPAVSGLLLPALLQLYCAPALGCKLANSALPYVPFFLTSKMSLYRSLFLKLSCLFLQHLGYLSSCRLIDLLLLEEITKVGTAMGQADSAEAAVSLGAVSFGNNLCNLHWHQLPSLLACLVSNLFFSAMSPHWYVAALVIKICFSSFLMSFAGARYDCRLASDKMGRGLLARRHWPSRRRVRFCNVQTLQTHRFISVLFRFIFFE
jgi:hypothetical protein